MEATLHDHQINLESFVADCHFSNGLLNITGRISFDTEL